MDTGSIVAYTLAVVALEALLSFLEGTFYGNQWRHLHMSFLRNWAVSIGDVFIFPAINILVVPAVINRECWYLYLLGGLFASIGMHWLWWHHDENLGHVFANWNKSQGDPARWMLDITGAGWIHVFFMAGELGILLAYVFAPMSSLVVLEVGGLLLVFVGIVVLQAKYVQGSVDRGLSIALFSSVVAITVLKLYLG